MARSRIGIWPIGAKGGVATTAITGLLALRKHLIGTAGLITATPPFVPLELVDWGDLVVGGHDIRSGNLFGEALRMHTESRAIDRDILEQCRADFDEIEASLRPGTLFNAGPTISGLATEELQRQKESPRQAIERVQKDLREFIATHRLDHVVVVNVSSNRAACGRPVIAEPVRRSRKADRRRQPLSFARQFSVRHRCIGSWPVVYQLHSLAGEHAAGHSRIGHCARTRHYGYDGKTGETLLKSMLAPMFAKRNLEVMSWVGHNIFGNMDAKVLDDPANKQSKVTSKDRLLSKILGYVPQTLVTIENIASWETGRPPGTTFTSAAFSERR